jgi:hypothetical protein
MELSGQTNGLIILASASLAITQYFHNHLSDRFAAAQDNMKEAFREHGELIPESMRQNYDSIRAKKIKTASLQICGLFIILVLLGITKVVELLDISLHAASQEWSHFVVWLLIIETAAYTLILVWIAVRLGLIRNTVLGTERESSEFVKQAEILAEANKKGTPAAK